MYTTVHATDTTRHATSAIGQSHGAQSDPPTIPQEMPTNPVTPEPPAHPIESPPSENPVPVREPPMVKPPVAAL